jgi:Flp pilus assembly protein TadD
MLPARGSPTYNQAVTLFYVGLAALQVGDDVRADAKLAQLTQLVPDEPAGWANWALLALRQRNYASASERLERARTLASRNGQIYYLKGILESTQGHSPEAIVALRQAIAIQPSDLRATYLLAEEIERQGGDQSEAEFQQLLQKILEAQPDNLAALLELARVAGKRDDGATLRATVGRVTARGARWPPEVQEQLKAVQTAVASGDSRAATTRLTFLRNVLVRVPEYRRDLVAIKPPPGEEAEPFERFLSLESPVFGPAPPDSAISFAAQPAPRLGTDQASWMTPIWLGGDGGPALVTANERQVRVDTGATFPFPGGASGVRPSPEGILGIDFNYDFRTDLVLAGAGGVKLMRQDSPNAFTDVTAAAKLPAAINNGRFSGAWAVDIEADGDLDIVLGVEHGVPPVLRNNGDGTFAELQPFTGVSGLADFVWVDLDADGVPDGALIDDMGKLHVFENERSGQFRERVLPALPQVLAINAADINDDGIFDLLLVGGDGVIRRLSDRDEGQGWDLEEVTRLTNGKTIPAGAVRLRVADLDNNGGIDLLLTATGLGAQGGPGFVIWLSDQKGGFAALSDVSAPALVCDVADVDGDGKLDLLGLSAAGQPVTAINHSARGYHWQAIRPRAKQAVGDQRINSFGVGGEMEIRSGLLLQKQRITGPLVHFGLGEQPAADVVRVVWPNGSVRAEFELQADQVVVTEQRLKGSCPFLFAFDGREMAFVKDAVPWGSAIGLRINTLGTARVEATEEWYKIRSDQLAPRDGYYDLRITAELWETYYYDQLGLMVVDHPVGSEIFVDERFVIPPAKLAITTVATPQPLKSARDDQGQDVTEIVSKLDGRYLDTFGRGQYQGVTRDHYVEVDLGDAVPVDRPLVLIAQGWMHPTDSSINVAISQGNHEHAKGLSLEVPDGKGGWRVANPNLGFPAGRKKICLIDLSRVFGPGIPHHLRLRTNLEIYWDAIEWAEVLPEAQLRTQRLQLDYADLHYRGYSQINQANNSSPELPDYNRIEGTTQRWRDLIGYYTRFGDVRELLARVDDRYVIMNSGDEMSIRFAAPPAPPAGWVRDYIITGDGWIKDGDYNSAFSKTVLPLPSHNRTEYTTAAPRLEIDPVYRRHPEDWQTYHTRYVTPAALQNALRPVKQP